MGKLVGILGNIVEFHQILYWLWLLQLKEYRLDRLGSDIKRRGVVKLWLDQYNLRRWYRPKVTVRITVTVIILAVLMIFLPWYVGIFFLGAMAIGVVAMSECVVKIARKIYVSRAREKMKMFRGIVIGVTGSYGKTSFKELLAWVLGVKFRVIKTEGNNNTLMGVTKTIINNEIGLKEVFIVEMGAYKQGEIGEICELVKPKVGVITGIGNQHVELFGGIENIKKAKYELIDSLGKNDLRMVAEEDFSASEAKKIKIFRDRIEFEYKGVKYVTRVIGKGLIRNVVGVIKLAVAIGMDPNDIRNRLEEFPGDSIYPKMIQVSDNCFVIDDTYNSSFESFVSGLEYLKEAWKGVKKYVVATGIIELGDQTISTYKKIAEYMGGVDETYTSDINFFKVLKKARKRVKMTGMDLGWIERMKNQDEQKVIYLKGRLNREIVEKFIK